MNKDEFMRKLEHLLLDLPADEREEALRYYEDYFNDAGISEETRIIEELGTPEKVAKLIKGNLFSKAASEAGEYTERGYHNPYEEYEANNTAVGKINNTMDKTTEFNEQPIDKDRTKTLLIVALVILTFPIWIGFLGAVFGITVGIFGALFGITVGFGAASIGLFVGAIVLLVFGIGQLFITAPTGVVMIGAALILIALGLLFLLVTILVVGKLIPFMIRGITALFNKLYHKSRRVVA